MNAQTEPRTILGMKCVMIEKAAAHMNMKPRGLEDLIKRTKKNKKVRNFPCIQLGGPGSTRWFNFELMDAWVAEQNGIELTTTNTTEET